MLFTAASTRRFAVFAALLFAATPVLAEDDKPKPKPPSPEQIVKNKENLARMTKESFDGFKIQMQNAKVANEKLRSAGLADALKKQGLTQPEVMKRYGEVLQPGLSPEELHSRFQSLYKDWTPKLIAVRSEANIKIPAKTDLIAKTAPVMILDDLIRDKSGKVSIRDNTVRGNGQGKAALLDDNVRWNAAAKAGILDEATRARFAAPSDWFEYNDLGALVSRLPPVTTPNSGTERLIVNFSTITVVGAQEEARDYNDAFGSSVLNNAEITTEGNGFQSVATASIVGANHSAAAFLQAIDIPATATRVRVTAVVNVTQWGVASISTGGYGSAESLLSLVVQDGAQNDLAARRVSLKRIIAPGAGGGAESGAGTVLITCEWERTPTPFRAEVTAYLIADTYAGAGGFVSSSASIRGKLARFTVVTSNP